METITGGTQGRSKTVVGLLHPGRSAVLSHIPWCFSFRSLLELRVSRLILRMYVRREAGEGDDRAVRVP